MIESRVFSSKFKALLEIAQEGGQTPNSPCAIVLADECATVWLSSGKQRLGLLRLLQRALVAEDGNQTGNQWHKIPRSAASSRTVI